MFPISLLVICSTLLIFLYGMFNTSVRTTHIQKSDTCRESFQVHTSRSPSNIVSNTTPVIPHAIVSKPVFRDPKNPPLPWIYPRFYSSRLGGAKRVDDDRLLLYTVDDFLNEDECNHIIHLIQKEHRPSTVVDKGASKRQDYYRTSSSCDLCHMNDRQINDLEQRMGEYVGLRHDFSEGMQGQYYKYKQEFKRHTDYFDPGTEDYTSECTIQGQRTWTFMLYLNDVEEGGETTFTRIDKIIHPKRGMGVIWMNGTQTGEPNPDTEHQGNPVKRGEKYIITKWFRERNTNDEPGKLLLSRQIPMFTNVGFQKMSIPESLQIYLDKLFRTGEHRIAKKTPDDHNGMIMLNQNEKHTVQQTVIPLLESWLGRTIEFGWVTNIHVHNTGATTESSDPIVITDRCASALLCIHQTIDRPWLLSIKDHLLRTHSIHLRSGEMLLYESARLTPVYTTPLSGRRVANLQVHGRIQDWNATINPLESDLNSGLLTN